MMIWIGAVGACVRAWPEARALYWNLLALACVAGGTFTALLLTYSLEGAWRIVAAMCHVFSRSRLAPAELFAELVQLASVARTHQNDFEKGAIVLREPFARQGLELLKSGLPREEFESILRNSANESRDRDLSDAAMFRVLAKFPPAFGLLVTIGSIVSLLPQWGTGSEVLIPRVSLSLLATLYGLGASYLIFLPLSFALEHRAERDAKLRECVVQALVMVHEKSPVVLVRERLKSHLSSREQAAFARKLRRAA